MRSNTEVWRLEDLKKAPKCVLFVEDNIDDYSLACWHLSKVQLRNRVMRVRSADELLEYLRAMDQYLDRDRFPMPAVIIMDMHLPGANGLEAQKMLRTNLQFRHIPVVVISSPESLEQLKGAVDGGADAWMLKPFEGSVFADIARELKLPLFFDAPRERTAAVAVMQDGKAI